VHPLSPAGRSTELEHSPEIDGAAIGVRADHGWMTIAVRHSSTIRRVRQPRIENVNGVTATEYDFDTELS